MRSCACFIASMIVSLLTIGTAPAGESLPEGYWACQTQSSESTIYWSAVFDAKGAVGEMNAAFSQMLKSKYGFTGSAFCGMAYKSGTTLDAMKAGEQRQITQQRQQGKKVIETGWMTSSSP